MRTRILAAFPEHGLVGEEYGAQPSGSGRRWIIDPIDGTHNYIRGVPIYATLLALEIEDELAIGIVSAPALRRRWFSWRGGGAWALDLGPGGWERASATRISVSEVTSIEDSSVVYSSYPSVADSGLAPGFGALLSDVWRDRGLGDFYGYVLVAEGAAEAMVESELKLWGPCRASSRTRARRRPAHRHPRWTADAGARCARDQRAGPRRPARSSGGPARGRPIALCYDPGR